MKKFFFALTLTLFFVGRAEAGYEEGVAARTAGDYAEALSQWMVASDDPRCMTAIGVMHEYGEGLPENDDRAAEWYAKAANKGSYRAIAQLANFSLRGAGGVARNPTEWRGKLEEIKGKDSYADYVLATFYVEGHGGRKNLTGARELLSAWVAQGYPQLAEPLRQVERLLADQEAGVLEVDALAVEIERGNASFDRSYRDKRILVGGWVRSVERLNDYGCVVKLGGRRPSVLPKDNVLAVFYEPSRAGPLASLTPGTFVKLSGVYVGTHPFPLGDCAFTLFGCSLVESADLAGSFSER
ncbi:MAG: hypothetical protein LBD04_04295 [Synergistaceae bacterium]|jgi:hypothetical protein|nr:hypothetical protein [Synergistaceae bacterium]